MAIYLPYFRTFRNQTLQDIFCVGVMYSGEYYSCDVTLSVSTPGKLEIYACSRWESANLRPLEY